MINHPILDQEAIRRAIMRMAHEICEKQDPSPLALIGIRTRGVTLAERLSKVKNGDIIIAHMNKPAAFTAEGVADALPILLARGFQFVKLEQIELQTLNETADRNMPKNKMRPTKMWH